ncbi:hypothetical protein, partial [Succinimonas sp.]|uniref:hypothetical protein n=1 Tax=Succinimonas sp. TaxID=1936151 RepID=UPI003863B0A0
TFSEHLNPGFLRLGNLPEILTGLLQVIGYRLELCFFQEVKVFLIQAGEPKSAVERFNLAKPCKNCIQRSHQFCIQKRKVEIHL